MVSNNELLSRIKTNQYFIFWTAMFLLFFYEIKQSPTNEIYIIFLIFIIFFSYIIAAYHFIQICGSVGGDMGESLSNFFTKHKKTVVIFIQVILGILSIAVLIGIAMSLPNNHIGDRISQYTIGVAVLVSGIFIRKLIKK